MVTVEELEGRRNLASQGDLADLLNRLTDQAGPLLARTIPIPTTKVSSLRPE